MTRRTTGSGQLRSIGQPGGVVQVRTGVLLAILALGASSCSDDGAEASDIEPAFELDSEDARQLISAIETLMEAESFVVTAVVEPGDDGGRQEVRMTYDAPDRAMIETDRLRSDDTVEYIDGDSIIRPFGRDGGYLRTVVDVDGMEIGGTTVGDVELRVVDLLFSPLRDLLAATDVEREGDDLVLTRTAGEPLRARLDGDGALVRIELTEPESGQEQEFTFSELNVAEGVDLPDDIIEEDDLPSCDEPRPISEASCRGRDG